MAPNTSRTLLVTLLGAFARRTDGWLPISSIVALMEVVGVDESSTRTGVSRLKKRAWLDAQKIEGRNGYRLTEVAERVLAEGDQVIWHARQPAALEDGWCIVTFSIPEKLRAKRHLLRSRLSALGFGNASQGVWIATARMAESAHKLVADLQLKDNANIFVGAHAGGQELSKMVNESWDLQAIDAKYREFIQRHEKEFNGLLKEYGNDIPPNLSFLHYVCALDDWRMLPMRDPGLPRELLHKHWAGDPAAALFEEIVQKLDKNAFTFVKDTIKS